MELEGGEGLASRLGRPLPSEKTQTDTNISLLLEVIYEVINTPSTYSESKVKCTLVQALRLCTGRTAHRGSRGIALPSHDHGTKRG